MLVGPTHDCELRPDQDTHTSKDRPLHAEIATGGGGGRQRLDFVKESMERGASRAHKMTQLAEHSVGASGHRGWEKKLGSLGCNQIPQRQMGENVDFGEGSFAERNMGRRKTQQGCPKFLQSRCEWPHSFLPKSTAAHVDGTPGKLLASVNGPGGHWHISSCQLEEQEASAMVPRMESL